MPPRPPKVLGFSPSDFNRVARMLKDYEQGFPQLLSKRTPYTPGQNHQWVKLDSTTPSSGRYDGKWYERDESTPGWTAKDDVWVVFANGATPSTSKYYLGVQTGYQDSRPVFCVFDQEGSIPTGTSEWILHHYKIEYSDFSGAGLTSDILLDTFGNSTIFLNSTTASHHRIPIAFAGPSLSQALINVYADDGSGAKYNMGSINVYNFGANNPDWSYQGFSQSAGASGDHVDFGQPVELRATLTLSGVIVDNLTAGEFWVAVTACTLLESL